MEFGIMGREGIDRDVDRWNDDNELHKGKRLTTASTRTGNSAALRGKRADSIELSPNITAELNERGELIGIEILEASFFLRNSILESSQAKILKFKKLYNNQIQRMAHSYRWFQAL